MNEYHARVWVLSVWSWQLFHRGPPVPVVCVCIVLLRLSQVGTTGLHYGVTSCQAAPLSVRSSPLVSVVVAVVHGQRLLMPYNATWQRTVSWKPPSASFAWRHEVVSIRLNAGARHWLRTSHTRLVVIVKHTRRFRLACSSAGRRVRLFCRRPYVPVPVLASSPGLVSLSQCRCPMSPTSMLVNSTLQVPGNCRCWGSGW